MNDTYPKWPSTLKKTRSRLAVWQELQCNPAPVSAAQLFEHLIEKHPDICLSTVYRNLEVFAENQVVIRTSSPDSAAACYGLNIHNNTHLAICIRCHSVRPVADCAYERVDSDLSDDSFHVTGHRLELLGYCDACFRKTSESSRDREALENRSECNKIIIQ